MTRHLITYIEIIVKPYNNCISEIAEMSTKKYQNQGSIVENIFAEDEIRKSVFLFI